MSKQLFETEHVGDVGVDSGSIELGDVGEVPLTLPTRCGDWVYPVTAIKVNGEVRGYFIGVDALEDWVVTEIDGEDKPWPPATKLARKKAVRKLATA